MNFTESALNGFDQRMRELETNGASTSKLTQYLQKRQRGTDSIAIGSDVLTNVRAASMADVMERVAGIRYLLKDWIPFGMLTMLVGEPGGGKSAFALYALVRVIITG